MVVSVVCLVFFDAVLHWSAVWASTAATAIATLPSYHLNRKWAWGKSGPSHMWREVVPFWVLAFIGWGFSTYSVKLTETAVGRHHDLVGTGLIALAYIGSYGVLWIVKFVVINKLLFVHHHQAEGQTPAAPTPTGRHRPAHLKKGSVAAVEGAPDDPDGTGPNPKIAVDAA